MKMIRDGNKHRFDLLLVKSLSRLGRDTLKTITQIRKWRNNDSYYNISIKI